MDSKALPLQSQLVDSVDTASELRSHEMARRCVLVGLLFALVGAVGGCLKVHSGYVRGAEAWLILASVPIEVGLFLFALLARSRAVVAATSTIVFYTVHLSAEIIVTVCSGAHQLDTLTFLIWS